MSKRPPDSDNDAVRLIQDTLKARYDDLLGCDVSLLHGRTSYTFRQSSLKKLLIST